MSAVLFFGGMQLLSIGVLGEYVSRLFVEAKQRPLYLIAEKSKPITTTTGVALSDEAQTAVFSSKTNGNSQ
jgi:hypothetical protein